MQSSVHLAPGLEYASKRQAATNKPGSTGICRAIFEHWPSEQLQGPIRPAAFRSSYLRDDQHQDGRDLFNRCMVPRNLQPQIPRLRRGGYQLSGGELRHLPMHAIEFGVVCQKRRNRPAKNGGKISSCVRLAFVLLLFASEQTKGLSFRP